MWGGSEREGAQQMPKQFLLLFRSNSQYIKHLSLQILLVNSDTASPNFHAIQHDVVGFRSNFRIFARCEKSDVLSFGPGKGVMHSAPLLFDRVKAEQRKIQHPEKFQFRGIANQ